MSEPLLRVAGLAVSYGAIRAVRGVDLLVERQEIVSIVGPNGAGKSSLIAGIMGAVPATGRVELNGQTLAGRHTHRRVASGISVVPEGRRIFGNMSVEQNLDIGAYWRPQPDLKRRKQDMFGLFPILHERRKQIAGELSGGQQQMLAIARALMSQPQLLLMDEPSIGLAPTIVADVIGAIESIRRDGVAVLLVEQNSAVALDLAERAYVMTSGHFVADGPTADIKGSETLLKAYLT